MTRIISQDELDALVTSIGVASRRRRRPSEAVSAGLYDFRRSAKLSPDAMRVLQSRMGMLAGALNRTMSVYLNTTAQFRVHSLDVTSTEQYLRNLAPRPLLGVVTFDGGTALALWEMPAALAATTLDCMLGGRGVVAGPFPEATAIECTILRRFFMEVLSAWGELWDRLASVRPQVDGVVTSPAGLDFRAAEERLFTAVLECDIAGTRGMMRLCLPLGVVKRLLRHEREMLTVEEVTHLTEPPPACAPLSDTPVRVTVSLDPPPVAVSELLELRPGMVLHLRVPAAEAFTVHVGGAPKFTGVAGVANGRVAVRLVSSAENPGAVCAPLPHATP